MHYPKTARILASSQAFEILFIVMSCHVKSLFVDGEARDPVVQADYSNSIKSLYSLGSVNK